MSDFKAKMHQIRFRTRSHWGSSQRSPRSPSWIWGGLLLREGRNRGGDEREEKGGEGEGRREGRGGLSDNVAEEAFCLKSAPVIMPGL